MKLVARTTAFMAAALAGAFAAGEVAAQTWDSSAGPVRVATVADGLEQPWSMAWMPDGGMLVTEKAGRLRLIRNGQLDPTPIAGVPEVLYRGQGGLLDVALHPAFEENRIVYLSYSKPSADGETATTALARGRLQGHELVETEDIFVAEAWSGRSGHYGGRIAFDDAGYLFLTVGDRQADPNLLENHPAQDLSNHQGTVNRFHDDGSIPTDNPFVNREGAQGSIWSYGHRNLQGLAFHPTTGDLWQTEHGPQGGDELNRIEPGRNYGWPVIGYGVNYGGQPIHRSREMAGMEQPVQFFTPSIATSGLMIYDGDRYEGWEGSIFMGGLAHQLVARLALVGDDARTVGRPESPPLLAGMARVRDLRQGPDGLIYVALDERDADGMSRIVRLEPAESN